MGFFFVGVEDGFLAGPPVTAVLGLGYGGIEDFFAAPGGVFFVAGAGKAFCLGFGLEAAALVPTAAGLR